MNRLFIIRLFTHAPSKQRGFSMIELMIAMTLGILLTGGVITMFASNKRVYTEQDQLGRLQETARFAMNMIVEDLRMAGHAGCPNDLSLVTNHINGSGTSTSLFRFIPLEGSENAANWKPDNSTEQVADMVAGSDGFTARYLQPLKITVTADMTALTDNILVNTVNGLRQGQIIAIGDCKSIDNLIITNADPSGTGQIAHASGTAPEYAPGNSADTLSKLYGTDAKIMRYVARRYFIGNGASGPALFMASGSTVEEMFEGVESMQILYGEDNVGGDSVADRYVAASAIVDWSTVVSVRVGLLMRTVNEYGATNTATYDVNGTTVDPVDDRRRRRVFTTTVQLRNKAAI